MGAIVMDNRRDRQQPIIAAAQWCWKVPKCPLNYLCRRACQKAKDIDESHIHGEINRIANNCVRYADWFRDQVNSEKAALLQLRITS